MSVYRLEILCNKTYKTINKLNSEFMNIIFKVKENKWLVKNSTNLEKPEWIEPGCCWNKMFESI